MTQIDQKSVFKESSRWPILPITATILLAWVCSCSPPSLQLPEVPSVSVALDPAFTSALSNAQAAVRREPANADHWGRLGQAFEAAEFNREALLCYERAAQLNPSSPRWLHLLALRQLQDHPYLGLTNLARAAQFAPPTHDAPRLRLAQALVELGHPTHALPHLQQLLLLNSNHPAARLELARIKFTQNEFAAASALLQPALTNPFTARSALLLLSQLQHRSGHTNHAVSLAHQAASLPKPFDWPDPYLREVLSLRVAHQNLSEKIHSLLAAGKLDQAQLLLDDLLARTPDHPEALLLLGRLHLQKRRCPEAEQALRQHLAAKPDSLQGLTQLGLALFCQDRWPDAAQAFQQAVSLKPDFAQGHFNLAVALSRSTDSAGAITAFRNAIRCQPTDASAHGALAEELLRIGQRTEALAAAHEALRLDRNQPKALKILETLQP